MKQQNNQLKVVIVGGSIAGLTLAHCLERNNIDYVVLERSQEIAPQIGASISLMPNGSRIMDQLGMFDAVSENIEPCVFMQTWTGNGKLLSETDAPILTGKRLGYTITFLERERLLKVLYDHLPDKSKVLTGKYVKSVEQTKTQAIVHCQDGSKFSGDVIAGADGIRSSIRAEMRRHIANEGSPSDLEALERDKTALSAEYSCLFGISKPIKGLSIGHTHRSCSKGSSTLLFGGPQGRIYWFLFTQNPERKFGDEIPRYSKEDEMKHAAKFSHHHVSGDVFFSKVWENRIVTNYVAIEEMENEHWVWNRVACLGDSVHKMTPNLGQGANCAIESAAELANALAKITSSKKNKPAFEEVTNALLSYHRERCLRANLIVKVANKFTRVEALATTGDWVASMLILPRLGDILADRGCKVQVGATKLDVLPAPERALQGTMTWSPHTGVGKEENRKRRAQLALPLLLSCIAFYLISRGGRAQQIFEVKNIVSNGLIHLSNGEEVPLLRSYLGWPALDARIAKGVATFMLRNGPGAEQKLQWLSSTAHTLPVVVVWSIESFRRGNVLTVANIFSTILLILSQSLGSGLLAPIYYFLHYVQSPQENFAALDNRLTNMAFVKVFLPALLLVYVTPSLAIYTASDPSTVQWVYGCFYYPFSVYLALALKVLSIVVRDTTRLDRLYRPTADLPYLRFIYGSCAILCFLTHIYTHVKSPLSISDSFAASSDTISRLLTSDPSILTELWEANELFAFGAAFYWIILTFGDLKSVGRLQAGWLRVLITLGLTTAVAGPGAAVLFMWAWREEAMARKPSWKS